MKNNKKESLPKPKGKTKLGSPAEIETPTKTADDLKHSLASPTERSKMKSKSESISGATQSGPDPKLMDRRQCHPEDADMHSTRS